VIPSKMHAAAKSAGVTSSKTTPTKVVPVRSAPKATVAPGAGVSKPRVPLGTVVSKSVVAMIT
jgi:hypothetical protein